jgi:hypothetical protein
MWQTRGLDLACARAVLCCVAGGTFAPVAAAHQVTLDPHLAATAGADAQSGTSRAAPRAAAAAGMASQAKARTANDALDAMLVDGQGRVDIADGMFRTRSIKNANIAYQYALLGAPTQEVWMGKNGTVSKLCKILQIPPGSRNTVLAHLEYLEHCITTNSKYDLNHRAEGSGGHNKLIEEGTVCSQIIANAIESGWGIHNAYLLVNEELAAMGKTHVSESAVYSAYKRLEGVVQWIGKVKQGSSDPASAWSKGIFAPHNMQGKSQLLPPGPPPPPYCPFQEETCTLWVM